MATLQGAYIERGKHYYSRSLERNPILRRRSSGVPELWTNRLAPSRSSENALRKPLQRMAKCNQRRRLRPQSWPTFIQEQLEAH